jgi:hypothetical protein
MIMMIITVFTKAREYDKTLLTVLPFLSALKLDQMGGIFTSNICKA